MSATNDQSIAFKSTAVAPTDFKIISGGFQWPVHSNLLSKWSRFFQRVCDGEFRESQERKIELHDNCPWAVAASLYWLYENRHTSNWYSMTCDEFEDEVAGLMINVNPVEWENLRAEHEQRPMWEKFGLMYRVATKYEMEDLAQEIREELYFLLYRDATALSNAAKFMGPFDFAFDKHWRSVVLDAMFEITPSATIIHNDVKTMFDSDPDVMAKLQEYMLERLERSEKMSKDFKTAVYQAGRKLAEARGRARGGLIKTKLEEASDILEQVDEKWKLEWYP